MFVGILKKGDRVVSVTSDLIAIERKNGQVDILPLLKEDGLFRIDTDNVVTIGYGDNVIEVRTSDITVTTF